MNLKSYMRLDDRQNERFEKLYEKYKKMYNEPSKSTPAIIMNIPSELPCWEDRLDDPYIMLKSELDALKPSLDVGDDRVPAVRVSFGTALIASAFGCDMFIPPNNLPCAKNHVLTDISKVYSLKRPDKDAGWLKKLGHFTEFFLENIPDGYHIQLPDIQSPFNNAHLIRGNDILFDFYDCPDELSYLLDFITDYMIDFTKEQRKLITNDENWFVDWGSLWKGSARISDCTVHLISPDMYKNFVLKRDIRYLESVGGGRIHYCGTYPEVIDSFINIPVVTGFDYDDKLHTLWDICERTPEKVVVTCWTSHESQTVKRLLAGQWPKKRNIVIMVDAPDIYKGKDILNSLRQSAMNNYQN